VTEAVVATSVDLFERASQHAQVVMSQVTSAHLTAPTPCSEWTVQQLIDHMVGGPDYLLGALAGQAPQPRTGATVSEYRAGIAQAMVALRAPDVLSRTCQSPLGFEWTVEQAVAGTFMDQLIHTWDLATATGQDATLDPDLVAACVAMFLPDMPEIGRAGRLVGPAVVVPDDATPQDTLLGAMGRTP